MTLAETLTDTRLQAMNAVHRSLISLSGGRIGHTVANMPVYKVTTTGRRSNQPRTVLLTAPVRQAEQYVFVASKGGDDRHPDWYHNMVANPAFTAEPADGGDPIELMARTATPEEKVELWPQIVAANKGYRSYQNKTDRDIPIVIAEPTA